MKRTPLRRKTPMKRAPWDKGPRTGLRQVSGRRRRELEEYRERRAAFLERPENKVCIVALLIAGERRRTTDVHHKSGRNGKRLNEETLWMAVSRKGHDWIHSHPNEARRRGWLI